jgi:N-acetylglucosaminyldiphosphoundecaprenol N-acetyl-beta-D-mannosaminyltransferase
MNIIRNRYKFASQNVPMDKGRIIRLQLNLISYADALVKVIEAAKQRVPFYVCFVNGHMSAEAYWDPQFSEYVNNGSLVLADGIPVVFSCRLLYGIKQERIAGMDFTPAIIDSCAREDLAIFLFGSTPDVLDALSKKIKSNHPELRIAGKISPSFNQFTKEEALEYVRKINESEANLVLVGMGCPKQEIWMAQYSKHINAPLLGVGGAFSVYAGLVGRAPLWMQKISLEWLYRLGQEPRRMWKRYLVTNTLFILLFIRDFFLIKLGIQKNDA